MKQVAEIKFLPKAFEISNGNVKHQIAWDEIEKIIAYKIDIFTVDEFCIDIIIGSTVYTISEEFHNWDAFVKVIKDMLPSKKDWFSEVAHPAFKRNETVLFEKSNTD